MLSLSSPLLLLLLLLLSFSSIISITSATCTSDIYCFGKLLDTVARSGVVNDTGDFVDSPLKYEPSVVLANFANLTNNNNSKIPIKELQEFINNNFYPVGSDLLSVSPVDWSPSPSFLSLLNDTHMIEFGKAVNDIWIYLLREWNNNLTCDNCYSHINVPYPFSIAGSSFTEYYYWDTFWIVEGLLTSGMYNTTKGIILNFSYLVQQLGFIPNGGRIYYLNRSQPPLFTQMVSRYYEVTKDLELLKEVVPILDLEYQYWMTNKSVNFPGFDNNKFLLSHYSVNNSLPRPESYMDDVELTEGMNETERIKIYSQIATTCESGWDFSSRWMSGSFSNLTTLQTSKIAPVDLNSIMYKNEVTLAELHAILGDDKLKQYYEKNAIKRNNAIQHYLFNKQDPQWTDYNFETGQSTPTSQFYASNFVPLWAGAYDGTDTETILQIVESLVAELQYPAGIPTSRIASGEQWDFPNGWAPLQYFAIEGLQRLATDNNIHNNKIKKLAEEWAFTLAQKWVNTNYCGWKKYNLMFEKYDVTRIGEPGGGGQYEVQHGFGWTNGVVLHLLGEYGANLTLTGC